MKRALALAVALVAIGLLARLSDRLGWFQLDADATPDLGGYTGGGR